MHLNEKCKSDVKKVMMFSYHATFLLKCMESDV